MLRSNWDAEGNDPIMKDWTVLFPIATLVVILIGLVHGIWYASRRHR
jgi:hypothetical protein